MATRRDFLATMAATLGAATLACAPRLQALQFSARLPHIGIQLYTVRSLMSKDFDGTLAKIAGIGYDEVEFAGYFGRTPDQVRAALTANKLRSPSTHLGIPASEDAWKKTLDDAKAIGHEWVIVASLPPAMHANPDDWPRVADRFNQLGKAAKEAGLRYGYHNHSVELQRIDDTTPLDVLLDNTDPSLVDFEMDLYWVVKGGGDPLDFIKRHPHRFPLMHAKDASPAPELAMRDVGSGTIDFGKIFAEQKMSGMQHVFVEHDSPTDAFASATNSFKYLASLK